MKRLWSVVQGYFTPALKKFRGPRWGDQWHSDWHVLETSFCCCVLHCCEYKEILCGHPTLGTPLTPIVVTSNEIWSCRYDSKMTTYIWLQIRIWTKTYSNSSLQDTDNLPVFQACASQSWKIQTTSSAVVWYQLNEPLATSQLDLHNNLKAELWNTTLKSLLDNRLSSEVNLLG